MTRAQRKTLEAFAAGELPLNRAIRAALRRIADLEQLLDDTTYACEAAYDDEDVTQLVKESRKLIGRKAQSGA